MAVAAAPQRTKRTVPEDALIYREYAHQVMADGEWGAYSRTARLCKVSHEHVRKVVARHAPPKVEPQLAYEPAPGEEQLASEREELAAEFLLCHLLDEPLATPEPEITSSVRSLASATESPIATDELDVHTIAYDVFSNAKPDRWKENRESEVYLLAGAAIVLTTLVILLSSKSLGLSLVLLPEVLGLWWIVMQMRRALY